jgi:hypothetical protein
MSSAALGASRGNPAATLTIGDVLALLKVDFPDLTISKIRFLEGEGLVCRRATASSRRPTCRDCGTCWRSRRITTCRCA